MILRLRLLMAATTLLYLGPLLAGLGGFGWPVVPVFTAVFLLWLVILRPQHWPDCWQDWQQPAMLVGMAAQVAVQLVLVTVCLGIGRGIGGVLGSLPTLPLMLPVSVSFLAVPLSRLVWNPRKAAQIDQVLDNALTQIAAPLPGHPSPARDLAARLLRPLAALPAATSNPALAGHLRAIARQADDSSLRLALLTAAARPDVTAVLRRALALHATDAVVSETQIGTSYPAFAYDLLAGDAALLPLFATRLGFAVQDEPLIWWDCPRADLLRADAVVLTDAPAQRALRDLADQIDRLAPPSESGANDA